jgi:hypothetical protein
MNGKRHYFHRRGQEEATIFPTSLEFPLVIKEIRRRE